MFHYDETANQKREHDRILARADKKYGGQTTPWRVSTEIKVLAQRFNVADLITLKPTPGKGLHVVMGNKLERCLGGDKHYRFLNELVEVVYDCGYNVAVGDGFLEIVKI